ncbi:methyltransferase, TIGR04325 family [Terrimonas sp. NA20]|uniref:Methyltransferase, TIGR04325 family n=1 Tax=Terrimonas ginsenosidimutans TaxID=2908004 RepID=A0ABS9KM88_9BACT|nr:methyltransferase, TIGR04325 family [Terrimonas ginsenosidimutans]MCG2613429.1 methyltransferase, TIGR04325 family [Terrimonas ginsenosidimutans]
MSFFKKKANKPGYGWFGHYRSWDEATSLSDGYEQGNILEKTKQALLLVKNGEAVYERDSVIFSESEYPYPLLAFLLNEVQQRKRAVNVLDFGGSLGSTYFQVREFLGPDVCASWNIIEQHHYIDCGKKFFQDETLQFYYTIADCLKEKQIDFVVLSSVVQYLPNPHQFLDELVAHGFDTILVDRTAFVNEGPDRITVQRVWPSVYEASYPAWFFDQRGFVAHFNADYRLQASFESYVPGEAVMEIDHKPIAYSRGFCFKRRK